jgi:hypothetical protein
MVAIASPWVSPNKSGRRSTSNTSIQRRGPPNFLYRDHGRFRFKGRALVEGEVVARCDLTMGKRKEGDGVF